MRDQKGITLVALAITVVITFILAMVSIIAAIGDEGLIDKSENYAEETEANRNQSMEELNSMLKNMDGIMNPEDLNEIMVVKSGKTIWNNGSATIKLKVVKGNYTINGYTIQYQKNSSSGTWSKYTEAVSGLVNNDVVWVRALKNGVVVENTTNSINILEEEVHPSEYIKSKATRETIGSDYQTITVIAQDKMENQVVVPGGFKIADDSGTTVQEGIVIEDKDGNQFVWVPVSNINGDGSNKIIKNDGSEVEIILGRYTFANSSAATPGKSTIKQKGSEYDQTTAANVADKTVDTKYRAGSYYYELKDSRPSNELKDLTETNTTAKNLKDFIEKTETNKGFYIARYEASYGGGYNADGTTSAKKFGNAKPLSKVSTANSTSSMNYEQTGTLWNFITQPQAAIVSQNMYKNDKYVESDLINSYAWDTAIVYIQAMGNANYANANRGTNTTLKNTGKTGDERCKIFDMAGNTSEWTTEYSTYTLSSNAYHCTVRGGYYYGSVYYTSYRRYGDATHSSDYLSFRPLLYVK